MKYAEWVNQPRELHEKTRKYLIKLYTKNKYDRIQIKRIKRRIKARERKIRNILKFHKDVDIEKLIEDDINFVIFDEKKEIK